MLLNLIGDHTTLKQKRRRDMGSRSEAHQPAEKVKNEKAKEEEETLFACRD